MGRVTEDRRPSRSRSSTGMGCRSERTSDCLGGTSRNSTYPDQESSVGGRGTLGVVRDSSERRRFETASRSSYRSWVGSMGSLGCSEDTLHPDPVPYENVDV